MKIVVAGQPIEIDETDAGWLRRNHWDGCYCQGEETIYIRNGQCPSQIAETFWHETLEAIKHHRLDKSRLSHKTLTIIAEEIAQIAIQLGFYPQEAWHPESEPSHDAI